MTKKIVHNVNHVMFENMARDIFTNKIYMQSELEFANVIVVINAIISFITKIPLRDTGMLKSLSMKQLSVSSPLAIA